MTEINDEKLVSRYLAGDKKSLEILIGRYFKPIYNFIYHYVGDAPSAEDITQDVFVRVWRKIDKFDENKKFKTWLFSIAKNAAIDFLKKKKAVPFSELENEEGENAIIENMTDPAPLPDELFARADLSKVISEALAELPPVDRSVLLLRHYNQFTFEEAAETLGEPLNTVKSRYRRALVKLRRILTKPI